MSSGKKDTIIELKGVDKAFQVGEQTVQVLKGVTLDIDKGEFAVLYGPSGCGKSTTLHVILGLEIPTKGEVVFLGKPLYNGTDEDMRAELRKRHIGTVYQQSNWIKSFTVIENVMFPLLLLGVDRTQAQNKASDVLHLVGMQSWKDYIPTELSAGQQQRIGVARALINDPKIIVADEPTGNLDYESGQMIMKLLKKLSVEMNKTILMVTHDLEYLTFATKLIKMFDGTVVDIDVGKNKDKILSKLKFKRGEDMSELQNKNKSDKS